MISTLPTSQTSPMAASPSATETQPLSADKFAVAFRLSPNMIIISTQADGRCLDVNEAYLHHTGYTREEVIGHTTLDLNMWANPGDRRKMLEQLARDGAVRGLEVEYRKKSGEIGCAIFYTEQITIDGEPCLLAMAQDVTEYKQTQAALSRYAADLQSRNDELDAFAHTVAHDLKSPLGNIIGFSEYLQTRPNLPEDTRQDFINTIARNAFKLDSIVDELLLLVKVRKGDVTLQPLDMGRVVSEALNHLTFMIAENSATVLAPDHWPVALGYGPWVEEVWVNYISNAIQHGSRPPHVELGAEVLVDGRVRCWVKDNGQGLPAEVANQLFEPVTQLATVQATGHGLGLSIVRHIVEKMGGTVEWDSSPTGSIFSFTLPAAP